MRIPVSVIEILFSLLINMSGMHVFIRKNLSSFTRSTSSFEFRSNINFQISDCMVQKARSKIQGQLTESPMQFYSNLNNRFVLRIFLEGLRQKDLELVFIFLGRSIKRVNGKGNENRVNFYDFILMNVFLMNDL